MVVMRVIPFEVPTFDKLGLPPVLAEIAESERGLILVTGMTGSGRTSTMAALVNHINQELNKHIVTLENPIEYLHRDLNSSTTQRDIGSDTRAFSLGLRAALRQDPDVILIGELSDAEGVDTALKAAENGHLVISALHATDATTTVSRVVALFPPEEQEVVRMRLADALCAVVTQRLLPRANGEGRCLAAEILLSTAAIRELIRNRTRLSELSDRIEEGRAELGMQSFDQHLLHLVEEGEVTLETAQAAAPDPEAFEQRLAAAEKQSGRRRGKKKRKAGDAAEKDDPSDGTGQA
jgi:twitching motility protein PilT